MARLSSAADLSPIAAPAGSGWQAELARAVTDPAELVRLLELPDSFLGPAGLAAAGFRLLVPRPYLARMRRGDPRDPLLVQVLPQAQELHAAPGFTADPLAEADAGLPPGLLWKYPGRALIVTTGACAVHCRFCFRRHYPYERGSRHWEAALAGIAAEPSIHEVILSGGDPLTLADRALADLVGRLSSITHVRRLRIHTRLPVVLPQRVTDDLVALFRAARPAVYLVIHANHPAEFDAAVAAALERLLEAGIVVLNQTVLLRGVNDNVETLAELCERLADLRVLPYYLHQLDRVAGVAHFEVPEALGIELIAQLRARLPGYAVPRYVREVPGEPHKIVLA